MGPIVIYHRVNIIVSEFELDQQRLNECVHPGHKGLKLYFIKCYSVQYFPYGTFKKHISVGAAD